MFDSKCIFSDFVLDVLVPVTSMPEQMALKNY